MKLPTNPWHAEPNHRPERPVDPDRRRVPPITEPDARAVRRRVLLMRVLNG